MESPRSRRSSTRQRLARAAAAALALSAPACGGDGGANNEPVVCMGTQVIANAANNYSFSSTLSFPPVKVAPKTAMTLDWTNATADFQKHPVDPRQDIDMVQVFMFSFTLDQLQKNVNADTVLMQDLTVLPITYFPDGTKTTAGLFDFSLNGTPPTQTQIDMYFDPVAFPPADFTYALLAARGTVLGQGTLMIQSFQIDPSSTNTTVSMKADSTQLMYSANLHSLKATGIPAGQAAVTLDWGMMTKNALGADFVLNQITEAMVAHYTQTPAQLETKFLDLELLATDIYRGAIMSGTVVDFSMLKHDKTGAAFPGIDANGTWVVALRCGNCKNPAPWYLSVLRPCMAM